MCSNAEAFGASESAQSRAFVHDLTYDALHVHVFAQTASARQSLLSLHRDFIAAG
jgi:hypothetical protein